MASRDQIKIIHSLKNALQLDDDEYRGLLAGFNVESSKDLSYEMAAQVIKIMTKNAQGAGVWQERPRSSRFENLAGRDKSMASPAQLRLIESLWNDVSFLRDPDKRKKALRKFLNRFDVSALEFVSVKLVPKIVRSLQGMKDNQDRQDRDGKAA